MSSDMDDNGQVCSMGNGLVLVEQEAMSSQGRCMCSSLNWMRNSLIFLFSLLWAGGNTAKVMILHIRHIFAGHSLSDTGMAVT